MRITNRELWIGAKRNLAGTLSDAELRIVELFIEGKSTPAIADKLGWHRSMVWRKARAILERSQAFK